MSISREARLATPTPGCPHHLLNFKGAIYVCAHICIWAFVYVFEFLSLILNIPKWFEDKKSAFHY